MTYYKAFNSDLTCRGYQFEVGKYYRHFDMLEMCRSGFHCCSKPLDCLRYYTYPFRLCEVTIGDRSRTVGDKTVTSEITIVREIIGEEFDEMLTGEIRMEHKYYEFGMEKKIDMLIYYNEGEEYMIVYYKKGEEFCRTSSIKN